MNSCIAPNEVTEGELEALAAGLDIPRIGVHVERCAYCAKKVRRMKRENQQIRRVLFRWNCPSVDELRDYESKFHLTPAQRQTIEIHLEICPVCKQEIAELSAVVPKREEEGVDILQQAAHVITTLFGKRLRPFASPELALRGGNADTNAQEYRVPEKDWLITLSTTLLPDGYILSGQVLVPPANSAPVARAYLLQDSSIEAWTDIDQTGYFVLRPSKAGNYEVWVETPDTRIVLADVQIGDAPKS